MNIEDVISIVAAIVWQNLDAGAVDTVPGAVRIAIRMHDEACNQLAGSAKLMARTMPVGVDVESRE
jgi:hypothetical protein